MSDYYEQKIAESEDHIKDLELSLANATSILKYKDGEIEKLEAENKILKDALEKIYDSRVSIIAKEALDKIDSDTNKQMLIARL